MLCTKKVSLQLTSTTKDLLLPLLWLLLWTQWLWATALITPTSLKALALTLQYKCVGQIDGSTMCMLSWLSQQKLAKLPISWFGVLIQNRKWTWLCQSSGFFCCARKASLELLVSIWVYLYCLFFYFFSYFCSSFITRFVAKCSLLFQVDEQNATLLNCKVDEQEPGRVELQEKNTETNQTSSLAGRLVHAIKSCMQIVCLSVCVCVCDNWHWIK